jgi:hypothetical protein
MVVNALLSVIAGVLLLNFATLVDQHSHEWDHFSEIVGVLGFVFVLAGFGILTAALVKVLT